jgi:hypothetical protein
MTMSDIVRLRAFVLVVAFSLALLAPTVTLAAPPLLIPVKEQLGQRRVPRPPDPTILRSQLVRVDFSQLRAPDNRVLTLQLFEESVDLLRDRQEPTAPNGFVFRLPARRR